MLIHLTVSNGKTKKQRRHLAKPATVHATDYKRIKDMLVK